jgi:hypothetical protein
MVDMLEKFFSAPAIALDKTVDKSKSIFSIVKDKVNSEIIKITNE